MDNENFEALTRMLPKLNREQLDALESRIKVIKRLKSATMEVSGVSGVSGDEHWWVELVAKVMEQKGVDFTRPDSLLRKIDLPELRRRTEDLRRFVQLISPLRGVQEAVISIGLDLLHDDLAKMDIPITSKIMIQHLNRLPAVIERSFPGYAKRRQLHILVQVKE